MNLPVKRNFKRFVKKTFFGKDISKPVVTSGVSVAVVAIIFASIGWNPLPNQDIENVQDRDAFLPSYSQAVVDKDAGNVSDLVAIEPSKPKNEDSSPLASQDEPSEVMADLASTIEDARSLEQEFGNEIDRLSGIGSGLEGNNNPRAKILFNYTIARAQRLTGTKKTITSYRNKIEVMYQSYAPTYTSVSLVNSAIIMQDTVDSLRAGLATDTARYNEFREDLMAKLLQGSVVPQKSQPYDLTYECGPGVSICGTINFDVDAYTIITTPDSYGGTLYRVVPQKGAKVPNLGYFESEAKAIESYRNWLSNNGY